nr:retrovirus-related Pol polyprotein from transposon TNT 1-94 [Tanacetum cinerariifolium]
MTIFNTLDSLGKFDGKVDEGFLVGYSVSSKGFIVFNSGTCIVQESLHVNFLENKPNVVGCGPTWLFDIYSLTKTMNYQSVTAGNQSNPSAGFQDNFDAEKAGEESDQQYVLFLVWSSGSTNPQNTDGDDAFNGKEPEFNEKKPESEVNIFLSSSAQSKKQDDKTKREAKGKKADFNKLETSITVSPIPTTRVHKDYPMTQIIGDLLTHTIKYTSPALTLKVFANMRRVRKGFFGVETPLFEGMLVAHEIGEGDADEVHGENVNAGDAAKGDVSATLNEVLTTDEEPSIPSHTPPTLPPQPSQDIPSTSQGRMIAKIDADADVVLEKAKEVADNAKDDQDADVQVNVDIQERQAEYYKIDLDYANKVLSIQEDESELAEVQEVMEVVTIAKLITEVIIAASITITTAKVPVPTATIAVAPRKRKKGAMIRDPEESTTTTSTVSSSEKEAQTATQARKNMMLYLKNVAGFKMDYFKGKSYDDIRPIFEAKFNSNVAFLQKTKEEIKEEDSNALKRINETSAEKAVKRQKLDEEVKELKRHLQIVPNEDDDVYTEATFLARKERFATTKPKNFFDDFLLITLGAMFKKPDIHAQIWKNQRSVHGPAKFKGWKLLESCGVQIFTFTTTQLILLVERKYPLTRFTLDQMINILRHEVEEESEVSLELLRFIRQHNQEGA